MSITGLPMLLLESEPLLRRTVVLTARTLGLGEIFESSNQAYARRLLRQQRFHGAVFALDFGQRKYDVYDLGIIDDVRTGLTTSPKDIPIAVLLPYCDSMLLQELRDRNVTRIILKPFRARVLLDTFSQFQASQST